MISHSSFACSCKWLGDFFEASKKMDLIVKAEVIEKLKEDEPFDTIMRIKILEKYKGNEEQNEILVYGDKGADCLAYISEFELGEVYYLALGKSLISNDKYLQGNCGELYLTEGRRWKNDRKERGFIKVQTNFRNE
ncbi:hypothetical protein [Sediminitomix flava]|uniref:Uncharacterized protein n=1 Tax=Sediminitomix flava TaxID=379075 RepID=A0A315YV38_SEDFL|nr:hypothetical protein [Sediminitomix flava]PWJ33239.1 hypothetical protein BC781_1141 [Sediminitomix flava]